MIKDILAIDMHTHLNHGSKLDWNTELEYYNGTLEYLDAMNKACNVEKMFASTFSSVISTEEVEKENEYMFELSNYVDNLYQWVVIDPRNKNTFAQAERMLSGKKCVGIKLHPVFHKYSLDEFGNEIFSFASDFSSIVLIHPEANSDYILPYANKYHNLNFIMAHMGSRDDDADYRAIKYAENNNVYLDTSGRASTQNRVIERVVKQVGSERIMFGTDTYAGGFQRGRIEYAMISDEEKANILRYNAKRLFAKFI